MKAFFVQIRDWISGVWYAARHARQVTDAILREPAEPPASSDHELPNELIESLMQLKSKEATVKGRTGLAATVWIPMSVLENARPDVVKQKLLIDRVAKQLVRRQLYGLWQKSEGTVEFPKTN